MKLKWDFLEWGVPKQKKLFFFWGGGGGGGMVIFWNKTVVKNRFSLTYQHKSFGNKAGNEASKNNSLIPIFGKYDIIVVRLFERRTDEELELNLFNQNNSQAAQEKTATQSSRSVAMVKQ